MDRDNLTISHDPVVSSCPQCRPAQTCEAEFATALGRRIDRFRLALTHACEIPVCRSFILDKVDLLCFRARVNDAVYFRRRDYPGAFLQVGLIARKAGSGVHGVVGYCRQSVGWSDVERAFHLPETQVIAPDQITAFLFGAGSEPVPEIPFGMKSLFVTSCPKVTLSRRSGAASAQPSCLNTFEEPMPWLIG